MKDYCQYVCAAFDMSSSALAFLSQPRVICAIVILVITAYILHYLLVKCASLTLHYTHSELNDFIISNTKELHAVYRPTIYLANGNLQTAFSSFMDLFSPKDLGIEYKRQLVPLPDGGQMSIDWPVVSVHVGAATPIVAIFSGLTGGRDDQYVALLVRSAARKGYKPVLVNHRGCSHTPLLVRLKCDRVDTEVLLCGQH